MKLTPALIRLLQRIGSRAFLYLHLTQGLFDEHWDDRETELLSRLVERPEFKGVLGAWESRC